jgi:hypothetical protein
LRKATMGVRRVPPAQGKRLMPPTLHTPGLPKSRLSLD